MTGDMLAELLEDAEALLADGHETALVGYADVPGRGIVAAYDMDKIVASLVDGHGMTHDDALDWLSYNIVGAYCGDKTPIYIRTMSPGEKLPGGWHP